MMQSAAAASERVFEFLEEEEEEQTVEHPVTLENGVEGHVTFEHVALATGLIRSLSKIFLNRYSRDRKSPSLDRPVPEKPRW